MLTDKHPIDRANRIRDLLASDVPDERALGLRELAASLGIPEVQSILLPIAYAAVERDSADPALPLSLPDTDWQSRRDTRGLLHAERRLRSYGRTWVMAA